MCMSGETTLYTDILHTGIKCNVPVPPIETALLLIRYTLFYYYLTNHVPPSFS